MIDIKTRHLRIIQGILKKYPHQFKVFGSRAMGCSHELSDLDLCIMDDVPWSVLASIQAEFEESDLPFKVDIVLWNQCSPPFKSQIEKHMKDLM